MSSFVRAFTHPKEQIKRILDDPFGFLWTAIEDSYKDAKEFIDMFSGPDMPDISGSPTYSSNQTRNTITEGVFEARCYGRCKIGGNKIRFNAADATDLRVIVGHCIGPVQGITEWYINDIAWGSLTGTHTKTEYKGTWTQTADGRFASRVSGYRGLAYTAFTFQKNDKQVGHDPNITCIMQGLLCAPLAGGADAFTRNPAVALYDFYRNIEEKSAGDLDLNSFKSLEALCNEVPTGSSLPRYRFDFNFDTNMTINDAKKLFWKSFNGQVIMSQGEYKCVWDSSQMADGLGGLTAKTVSHAFTEDNIVKDSLTWSQPSPPNIVRIHYIDGDNSYQKTSVEVRDENDIDTNGEIPHEEFCYYITDAEIARRRAKFKFNKFKYDNYNCQLQGFSDAGDLELYDLVTVTHQLPGWTTKQFLVTSKTEGQYGQPKFTLKTYYSGCYDDSQVGTQAGYESILPNPYKVPAASTGISATMTAVGTAYDVDAVRVSFSPSATDPFYSYSEIYASKDDATYYYIGRDGTGTFTFNALGVVYEPGDTCYIKIRSVSTMGVKENLPAVASTSVLISSTMRLGGFYAGLTFLGDNATPADAKILLDKTNTLMRLGPSSGNYLTLDGDYSGEPAVLSSNYVSGAFGAGFLLKSDLLEVGNIASRGIIRTAVFQKDVVSAVGGNLAVLPADLLNATMSADDSDDDFVRITEAGDTRITEAGDTRILSGYASLTIEGNETFASGDIIRIKDGTYDEWIEIGLTDDAPVYAVIRDKARSYADGANPAWPKGASVVNYGASGDGGVYMTSSEFNAPYLSIFDHAGEPWNTINTRLRLGNLNGFLGYSSDLYGIAIGETNKYLKYDTTNGLRIKGNVIITGGSGILSFTDAGSLAALDEVTAGEINVSSLSAIVADLGAITAGNITLDSSGFLRSSGKDNYADTTAGFFLGYDTTAYKLNIGNATKYMKWDGSDLTIGGDVIATGNIKANAVSTKGSNSNSSTAMSTIGSWVTIMTTTLTLVSGANVLCMGKIGEIVPASDALFHISIRLIRDTSVEITGSQSKTTLWSGIDSVSLATFAMDSTNAGSTTYALQYYRYAGDNHPEAKNSTLTIIEFKK